MNRSAMKKPRKKPERLCDNCCNQIVGRAHVLSAQVLQELGGRSCSYKYCSQECVKDAIKGHGSDENW